MKILNGECADVSLSAFGPYLASSSAALWVVKCGIFVTKDIITKYFYNATVVNRLQYYSERLERRGDLVNRRISSSQIVFVSLTTLKKINVLYVVFDCPFNQLYLEVEA